MKKVNFILLVLVVAVLALGLQSCAPAGYNVPGVTASSETHELRLVDKDAGVVCYVLLFYNSNTTTANVAQSCLPIAQLNKEYLLNGENVMRMEIQK